MVRGIEFPEKGFAAEVSRRAFTKKLLLETCGSKGQVVKLLPPLIIEEALLAEGLRRFSDAVIELWEEKRADFLQVVYDFTQLAENKCDSEVFF